MDYDFFVDLGDGVKRPLSASMAAMQRLKKRLGKSMMAAVPKGEKHPLEEMDEDLIPFFVHSLLVTKDITEDDVASMITFQNVERILAEAMTCFKMSLPEATEKN